MFKKQLLIDFMIWVQFHKYHVWKGNEKDLAEMFLIHLEQEQQKKDEEYKKNFIR